MKTTAWACVVLGAISVASCGGADASDESEGPSLMVGSARPSDCRGTDQALVDLGKKIFFDQRLSLNGNQACAACHGPQVGWTGPDARINEHGTVYEGSVAGRFGNRKPPSSAYASLAPLLHLDAASQTFVGGNFWDGRATGWKLGNPAADQAQGPFLNPAEQALPDSTALVNLVCGGAYGPSFRKAWGRQACRDVDQGYADIARSILAYESSRQVNRFSSKFDAYLAGKARLTPAEKLGLALFTGKAHCANCHTATPGPAGEPPLFTDFTYDNLGVPRNPENPVYAATPGFVDRGLGATLEALGQSTDWQQQPHVPPGMISLDLLQLAPAYVGKQKVPTLRNVDLRPHHRFPKAYTHNGYFKSLAALVHFYNTRDVRPVCSGDFTERQALAHDCWPPPEVADNLNTQEMGNLGLSPAEEAALVAFLGTLSDAGL
jgi:cytochrome c peroxidase